MTNNKLAATFGTLAGILLVIFCFGSWAAGMASFATFLMWYSWLPVVFLIILVGAFVKRKQLGGFMSFKEGIQFAFLAYVIFEIFYALSILVLFRIVDPQLQDKVMPFVIEKMRSFMERYGISKDQMTEIVEKAKEGNANKYTVGQVIMGFGLAIIYDFVKSVIIAAIAQRRKPQVVIKESNR